MKSQHAVNNLKNISEVTKQLIGNVKPGAGMVEEFNSIFKEAAAAVASNHDNKWLKKEVEKQQLNTVSLDKVNQSSVAQLTQGVANNAQNAPKEALNIVPLQIFLDNAIRSLAKASKQEFKVNDLIDQFVRGEISEDEVVLETAKLNLSISMITTIVQSAVQTFKEIQQIPV